MDNNSNYNDLTKYNSQMFYSPVTYLNYPIRDSLCFVIPLTLIYSVIFISGILGNIITCVVIMRNKNMHTATNYYLFSLAVSDLLLLVSGKFHIVLFSWMKVIGSVLLLWYKFQRKVYLKRYTTCGIGIHTLSMRSFVFYKVLLLRHRPMPPFLQLPLLLWKGECLIDIWMLCIDAW